EPRDSYSVDPAVGEPFDDESFDDGPGQGRVLVPQDDPLTTSSMIVPPRPVAPLPAAEPEPGLPIGEWWESLRQRWGEIEFRRPVWRLPRWPVRYAPRRVEVDYHDRISVATWMVILGLGVSVLLDLPGVELGFWALGSPVSIPF